MEIKTRRTRDSAAANYVAGKHQVFTRKCAGRYVNACATGFNQVVLQANRPRSAEELDSRAGCAVADNPVESQDVVNRRRSGICG
jgi:hypothetical protein